MVTIVHRQQIAAIACLCRQSFVWPRPVWDATIKHQNMPQILQIRIACKQGKSKSKSRSVRAAIGQVLPANFQTAHRNWSCTIAVHTCISVGSLPLPYYLAIWFCKNKPMMLCLVWCGKKIEVLVSTPKTSLYPKNIIYHLIPVWNQKKDVWEGISWSRARKWDPYWARAASKRMNSGFLHSTWNPKKLTSHE